MRGVMRPSRSIQIEFRRYASSPSVHVPSLGQVRGGVGERGSTRGRLLLGCADALLAAPARDGERRHQRELARQFRRAQANHLRSNVHRPARHATATLCRRCDYGIALVWQAAEKADSKRQGAKAAKSDS
jgi:hypothetical protein